MKQLTAFLSCCILFALTHRVYGQEVTPSGSDRAMAWEAFRAENGNNWVLRWDDSRNLPHTLTNGRTKVYEGTPEEAARSFLNEYRELFGMKKGLEDLQVQNITENRFGLPFSSIIRETQWSKPNFNLLLTPFIYTLLQD